MTLAAEGAREPGDLDLRAGLEPRVLSPVEGLRREMDLLHQVASAAPRSGHLIWRCQRSIVVPRSFSALKGFGAGERAMADRGWPVAVRETGGDVTPQSPGLLTVALAFSRPSGRGFGIRDAYEVLCSAIIEALKAFGVTASCGPVPQSFCDGEFNLAVGGRKIAGTAQRQRRIEGRGGCGRDRAILVHAVILCDDDLPALIHAANDFYRNCGVTRVLRRDRHVTLAELCPAGVGGRAGDELVRTLARACDRSLRRCAVRRAD